MLFSTGIPKEDQGSAQGSVKSVFARVHDEVAAPSWAERRSLIEVEFRNNVKGFSNAWLVFLVIRWR